MVLVGDGLRVGGGCRYSIRNLAQCGALVVFDYVRQAKFGRNFARVVRLQREFCLSQMSETVARVALRRSLCVCRLTGL